VVGLVAKSEANYLHLPCLLNKSCTLCLLNEDIPLGVLHTTLRIRLKGSGPVGLQELGEVRHAQLLARARRRVLTYRGCASSCHPCQSGLRIRLLRLTLDRKSTRLNSSHVKISYAVFCLKKKN